MKIKTTTGELKSALARFADVIPSNPAIPILACLMIRGKEDGGGVTMTGTNCDIAVSTELDCATEEPDVIAVPYRILSAIANSAVAGAISIETEGDGKVKVSTKSGVNRISTMNPELFPPTSRSDTEKGIALPCAALERMLAQTAFALASPAQGRKVLENTLVEVDDSEIRAVATNGSVLALSSHQIDASAGKLPPMLLPAKSCATIRRLLAGDEAQVAMPDDSSYAVFTTKDTFVKTKLHDGVYPNYRRVIPNLSAPMVSFSVDANTLIEAVRRTSIFAAIGEMRHIRCDFSHERIVLTARAEGIGETQETVGLTKFDGKEAVTYVNDALFGSALSSATPGELDVKQASEASPVVIEDGKGYMALVMPVRVS